MASRDDSAVLNEEPNLAARALALVRAHEGRLSTTEISAELGVSRITGWRLLSGLAQRDLVAPLGEGRARRWSTAATTDSHLKQPAAVRPVIEFDENRLSAYAPNRSFLLPMSVRDELRQLAGEVNADAAVWDGADIAATLAHVALALDTSLAAAPAASAASNHRAALALLRREAARNTPSPLAVRALHACLVRGLVDPLREGALRRQAATVAGSSYRPPTDRARLELAFERILLRAEAIEDPIEASFFLLAHMSYLQPFAEANQAVAHLLANTPLLRHGLPPLVLAADPPARYRDALAMFCETARPQRLVALYRDSYAEACAARRQVDDLPVLRPAA